MVPVTVMGEARANPRWSSTGLCDDILNVIQRSSVMEMHVASEEAQHLHNFLYDLMNDGHQVKMILYGSMTYCGQQGVGEKHDVDLDNSLQSGHKPYVEGLKQDRGGRRGRGRHPTGSRQPRIIQKVGVRGRR